jgi:hypothetical protein
MPSTPKTVSRKIKKFLNAIAMGISSTKHSGKGSYSNSDLVPLTTRPEVYFPGHVWDSQNPCERYASVGDLCAHIGDKLPIHLVKQIARDVLCDLANLYETRGRAHGGMDHL